MYSLSVLLPNYYFMKDSTTKCEHDQSDLGHSDQSQPKCLHNSSKTSSYSAEDSQLSEPSYLKPPLACTQVFNYLQKQPSPRDIRNFPVSVDKLEVSHNLAEKMRRFRSCNPFGDVIRRLHLVHEMVRSTVLRGKASLHWNKT